MSCLEHLISLFGCAKLVKFFFFMAGCSSQNVTHCISYKTEFLKHAKAQMKLNACAGNKSPYEIEKWAAQAVGWFIAHLCSFKMEMKSGAAALMCRNIGS